MLFESSEHGVFLPRCHINDVAVSDGVNYVFVVYGEVLQAGARGGGVLVQEDHQLLKVALVWSRGPFFL